MRRPKGSYLKVTVPFEGHCPRARNHSLRQPVLEVPGVGLAAGIGQRIAVCVESGTTGLSFAVSRLTHTTLQLQQHKARTSR